MIILLLCANKFLSYNIYWRGPGAQVATGEFDPNLVASPGGTCAHIPTC